MVRIKSVSIHNFGPYIDETIEFPEDDGICFVWGENGSGKTTLLNVFKYAFFGTLFDGKYKKKSKVTTMNYRAEDRYFGVTMRFTSDGSDFALTRNQRIKDGITKPETNADFKEDLMLIRDGEVLSPDDTVRTLNQLMPEDISQFFFFDSERLSVFEKLMDEDDEDGLGAKVKESIEKILGIPVLKNCVKALDDLCRDYDQNISKAVSKDAEQREISKVFERLCEKIQKSTEDLERKENELNDRTSRLEYLQQRMRENSKLTVCIENMRRLEKQLESDERTLAELRSEMSGPVSSVWKSMLRERIDEAEDSISDRYSELERKSSASAYLSGVDEATVCPICGREFDSEHPRPQKVVITDEEREELRRLAGYKAVFNSSRLENTSGEVRGQEKSIRETINRIYDAKNGIEDCRKQIGRTDEDTQNLENIQKEYSACDSQIHYLSSSIVKMQKELNEDLKQNERIKQRIRDGGSDESKNLMNRQAAYRTLKTLFEESIDRYCRTMKEKVEEDASEFFRKVDESGYYTGLKINDNYGLELVDRDGNLIPAPSTGYQHMIALSLIRGIHKNAPIEGPAIVDYLFGHIDDTHKPLVAEAVPLLARQVVVLAFKGEYDPNELRTALVGNLKREYRLIREEAYSTHIEIG